METCQVSEAAFYALYCTRRFMRIWCGATRIIIPSSMSFLLTWPACLVSEHQCLPFSPMPTTVLIFAVGVCPGFEQVHTTFRITSLSCIPGFTKPGTVTLVAHFYARVSVHGTTPNVLVYRLYISSVPTYILFWGVLQSILPWVCKS